MLLRWRAPELALLLADRAMTAAQDDKMAVVQADYLAVFALNRLGRHGEAAHRLFPAIRDADTPAGLRHELHVELAHCAAALGESATALGAVRAVLAAGDDVAPVLRGGALVAVAEASVALGRDDLVTSALDEADELYREDPSLDRDTALLLRAAVRAADAARHRRRGAAAEAEAKAREGRELLAGLADPEHDSGEVSARLMLEIALALLDRGAGDTAMQEARPLLRRPARAAAAAAVGRLRLALATRVHLAEGRHEPALTLLADAVEGAQRYGVDAVLAECLEGLSHVHEARGEFADALHCVRAARAAEGRHRRDVETARCALLENCGSARREEARLVGQVAALLGNAGTGCTGSDSDTGPLSVETAVGVAPDQCVEPEIPEAEISQAEEPEPEVTEVAEAEIPEAGVVAEQTAQLAEPTLTPSAPSISLVESRTPSPEPVDIQTVGEPPVAAKPVSQEHADEQSAESSSGLNSWQSGARHRRGVGTLVSVSDLLPASALSAGRSGRRRAEDRADETSAVAVDQIEDEGPERASAGRRQAADGTDVPSEKPENLPSARREPPASEPPPAPTPRALEWEPADGDSAGEDSAGEEEPSEMGLGDLLAEALAAYQESRDVHADARSTAVRGNDGPIASDVENSREMPHYRGQGTRGPVGLALAPEPIGPEPIAPIPSDAAEDDPAEAFTNPLLRLPDLTAEPRWSLPETGHRSAAGD
jgi:tetratricopeptide (TPR) repeat protein